MAGTGIGLRIEWFIEVIVCGMWYVMPVMNYGKLCVRKEPWILMELEQLCNELS